MPLPHLEGIFSRSGACRLWNLLPRKGITEYLRDHLAASLQRSTTLFLTRYTSMKKVLIVSILLVMSVVAGSALGARPEKSVILHCGCNEAGDNLVYKQISVSQNARGHAHHGQGTYDSCVDDLGNSVELMRVSGDCLVSGPQLRAPLPLCVELSETGGPQAGDICGVPAQ